jgi:hypothetical protein
VEEPGAYGNFLEALSKGHIINIECDLSCMVAAFCQFVLHLWVTNGSVSCVDIISFFPVWVIFNIFIRNINAIYILCKYMIL